MDYQQALDFLDRHVNLEKTGAVAGKIDGLSLEPMRRLMNVLGDPQDQYPILHVTGTNGKGSTARMIAELLSAHGLVVGLYTSPHLQKVNERLWWSGDAALRVGTDGEVFERLSTAGNATSHVDREDLIRDADLIGLDDEHVDLKLSQEWGSAKVEHVARSRGGPISDAEFAAVLSDVADLEVLSGTIASYFELLTAAAFSWFAGLPVDVAVVEVGLLGRFDATNVCDAQVAVITNIGADHSDYQGDWRSAVALEKAGIVKADSFLVLGEADFDLRSIFEQESDGRLWVRGEDFACELNRTAVGGRVIEVRTPGGVLDEIFVPGHGEHQGDNAAIAISAVEAFFARPLDVEVVQEAMTRVRLPGRFEVADRRPLVVIDGAHNPDGAATVAATLIDDFDITGRLVYVVGFLAGRDIAQLLEAMGARRAHLVIACSAASPRAVPATEIVAVAEGMGITAEAVSDVAEAIERARVISDPDDVIVITGSLYVAGAARDALNLA